MSSSDDRAKTIMQKAVDKAAKDKKAANTTAVRGGTSGPQTSEADRRAADAVALRRAAEIGVRLEITPHGVQSLAAQMGGAAPAPRPHGFERAQASPQRSGLRRAVRSVNDNQSSPRR